LVLDGPVEDVDQHVALNVVCPENGSRVNSENSGCTEQVKPLSA